MPDRLFLHPLEKLPGQVEAHVGFEQDPANFPEPLLDRLLGQYPAPGQLLKRGGEFGGQLVEHKPSNLAGLRAFFKRLDRVFRGVNSREFGPVAPEKGAKSPVLPR